MNRYLTPFVISISLHVAIVATLLFGVDSIVVPKETKAEKKVKINLTTYKIPEKIVPKSKPKKIIKKKVIKKKKKVIKKKIIKKKKKIVKKRVIKKIIKKEKMIKIPPKVVEPITPEVIEVVKTEVKKVYIEPEIVQEVVESEEQRVQRVSSKYIESYKDKISRTIESNKYYPNRARKRGIVGKVLVSFKISIDGSVSDIDVISSKHEILSRSAIKTIESCSGEFETPKEEVIIKVPIEYSLSR